MRTSLRGYSSIHLPNGTPYLKVCVMIVAKSERRFPFVSKVRPVYLCAIIPILVTTVHLHRYFGKTMFDFVPFWSDELIYWLASKTFRATAWSGGYFGVSEIQAPWSFSHWGLHGPLFPMLYAILNWPFGWHSNSAVVTNHVLLSLSIVFFVSQTRLPVSRQVILAGLLFTFWPLNQFSTTNMQESLHHSFALVLAALFFRFGERGVKTSNFSKSSTALVLVYLSCMRPSWSIFGLPFVLYAWSDARPRVRWVLIVMSVLLVPISPVVFKMLAAPMPAGGAQFIKFMTGHETMHGVFIYLLNNVVLLFAGDATEQNQRIQFVILILVGAVAAMRWRSKMNRHLIVCTYVLSAFLGSTVVMYIVGGQADYRVLSAPLLFSSLLLLTNAGKGYGWLIALLVALNLWIAPTALWNYAAFRRAEYTYDLKQTENFGASLAPFVQFDPVGNPWCNTLISGGLEPWVSPEFMTLPAGIGVITLWKWSGISLPPKSKFILLDLRTFAGQTVPSLPPFQVEHLKNESLMVHVGEWGKFHARYLSPIKADGLDYVLLQNLDSACNVSENRSNPT